METATIDLESYLERIGYDGPVEPSVEVLSALHEAHLGAIAFENLDILLGKPIVLELEALQKKLVTDRRGGYCFEQNTLFRAVLEAVGFPVTSLAARVRVGGPGIRPRTHMLLRIELPEGSLLADVGFGGDGPLRPLPLQEAAVRWTGASGHRFRREDEVWVLEGNATGEWNDLYAFTLEPHHPVDYEMANWFTSTHPSSPFVQNLTAQRIRKDQRAVLRNRDFALTENGAGRTETVRDPEHLLEILGRHFGLSFPAGTRFRKPEF
jgi:N-hydroxyarylamine O-acetyltransferase